MSVDQIRGTVFDADLPTIAYEHAESAEEAHRLIGAARQQGPIAIGPHGPEVLTYELVRTVLRDDRFLMPVGGALPAQGITSGELWDIVVSGLLSLNGPTHHRQRKLVAKAFTPRAASRLRNTCADIIAELIYRVSEDGRCDVVSDIARQYPIPIICELLGTRREDWNLFSEWADDIFKVFDWNVAEDGPDIVRAWRALESHLDTMVASRRDELTDDLLSDMMRAEIDGDRLSHQELLTLAATLLMAGTDTTRNQLAAAVEVFCDHPDQWTLLAENPELAPQAVEEVMRYAPVIFSTLRIAVDDVELAGHTVPAGTLVIANTAAANRDPEVYPNPDRFDITRADAPAMLTFGGGVHYCLGSHLARIELIEALTLMSRRMPTIRRSGPARWKAITGISGPATLPIAFDCGY
ncbi:cytochrome P450 [Mycolicibacterium hippocampi]|uniref:Steroid C26-monooxygenase n=1 Tax=Mycolicibacterium hippocampi TaxID=659824 RepID=A0A850PUS5_9MYCO|nr:cytochrome P450 [Mycolicibacterium hippocampi]NVN51810.1 putative cytochrome P450 hydroxylase [Mycolicibacterium hippocampi]